MSCGVSPDAGFCEAFEGAIGAAWTVVTVLLESAQPAERRDHRDDHGAAEQGGDEGYEEGAFHLMQGRMTSRDQGDLKRSPTLS